MYVIGIYPIGFLIGFGIIGSIACLLGGVMAGCLYGALAGLALTYFMLHIDWDFHSENEEKPDEEPVFFDFDAYRTELAPYVQCVMEQQKVLFSKGVWDEEDRHRITETIPRTLHRELLAYESYNMEQREKVKEAVWQKVSDIEGYLYGKQKDMEQINRQTIKNMEELIAKRYQI